MNRFTITFWCSHRITDTYFTFRLYINIFFLSFVRRGVGFSWFAFKMCFTNSFGVENLKNPTPKKIQREDV